MKEFLEDNWPFLLLAAIVACALVFDKSRVSCNIQIGSSGNAAQDAGAEP